MTARVLLCIVVALLACAAFQMAASTPGFADQTIRTADHPLSDPALEARARSLMREIRCVVCQSQSIDESDADIAANLRNIVREQISTGKSEAEIRDYLTARYGDFVLLKPPFKRATVVLWIAPFALALAALIAAYFTLRRSRGAAGGKANARDLTGAERARLQRLLGEGDAPDSAADASGGRS